MTFLSLGFFTGFSLILAIGAQNVFVIEQGLKRQFIFIVCLICAISDLILIFIGKNDDLLYGSLRCRCSNRRESSSSHN